MHQRRAFRTEHRRVFPRRSHERLAVHCAIGSIALGLDENHAHVQSTGAYHYHAAVSLLLSEDGLQSYKHSPLIGWAGDGFTIYTLYGWDEGSSVR